MGRWFEWTREKKKKNGKGKTVRTTDGGAENASTGKRKYGKCKYNANLQSDKKGSVLHKF